MTIVLAVVAAYGNSLHGPFIFDDVPSIPQNPHVRSLWPITEAMKAPPQETASGRPVLALSLALTYAACGLDVAGYHAVNIAIHVLASLTLFGIVRQTLAGPRLRGRFGRHASVLALAVALLWGLHPLLTQAVTYVIQRAESLMGLFYLLTLYCAIRSHGARRPAGWLAAAVAACALGMGAKEAMATAPVAVLAYDAVFLSRSFRGALRRWPLYAGLAGTWLILVGLASVGPRTQSAGFGLAAISPLDYAKTQCQVILHYIRLAFWPVGQVFDYWGWEIPGGLWDLYLPAATLAGLLALTAAGLALRPAAGFLGLWFFLILAPTSSFVPLSDVAFEHRMYLPLAAVATGAVLAGYALMQKAAGPLTGRRAKAVWTAGACLTAAAAMALGALTHRRNTAYRSEFSIWQDTARARPTNHRAHIILGNTYVALGQYQQALLEYDTAVRLRPDDPDAYVDRGNCYATLNRDSDALADYNKAAEINAPAIARYAEAGGEMPHNMQKKYSAVYNNRGIIYRRAGQLDLAIADFNRAMELYPAYLDPIYNRAGAYFGQGDFDKVISELDRFISADADKAIAYDMRGAAYLGKGRFDQAIADFETAIRLDPKDESYRQHRLQAVEMMKTATRPAGTSQAGK